MNNHNRLRVALAVLSGRFTSESMNPNDIRAVCPHGWFCDNDMRAKAEDIVFEYLTKKEKVNA